MTSVDWPGTYQGILPCADCEGIKTQLLINKDLNYILRLSTWGKAIRFCRKKANSGGIKPVAK